MSSYKVTGKRDCRELGYIKGMSVTVPMFADEVPLRGTGREKVRRMFMAQFGIDIEQQQAWSPTYPGMFDIQRI